MRTGRQVCDEGGRQVCDEGRPRSLRPKRDYHLEHRRTCILYDVTSAQRTGSLSVRVPAGSSAGQRIGAQCPQHHRPASLPGTGERSHPRGSRSCVTGAASHPRRGEDGWNFSEEEVEWGKSCRFLRLRRAGSARESKEDLKSGAKFESKLRPARG